MTETPEGSQAQTERPTGGLLPENPRSERPENALPTAAEGEGESGAHYEPPEHVREAQDAPAAEQSPVASERQAAVAGDSGLYEQEPQLSSGDSVNTPHRTSPLPAALQSGVPLAEDRAAGVKPGPVGSIEGPTPGTYAPHEAE